MLSILAILMSPSSLACSPPEPEAAVSPGHGAVDVPLDVLLRVHRGMIWDVPTGAEASGEDSSVFGPFFVTNGDLVQVREGEDLIFEAAIGEDLSLAGLLAPLTAYEVSVIQADTGVTGIRQSFQTGTDVAPDPAPPALHVADVDHYRLPLVGMRTSCDPSQAWTTVTIEVTGLEASPFSRVRVQRVEEDGVTALRTVEPWLADTVTEPIRVSLGEPLNRGPKCFVAQTQNAAGEWSEPSEMICAGRGAGCSTTAAPALPVLGFGALGLLLLRRRFGGRGARLKS
jgi:hypothetical protein